MRARFEASQDEVDEDTQPIDPSELVRKEWTRQMDPPPTLVLPVLPYQKEGLGWMYNQEHTSYHGRILADEMVSAMFWHDAVARGRWLWSVVPSRRVHPPL